MTKKQKTIEEMKKWRWSKVNQRWVKTRIKGNCVEERELRWHERLFKKLGIKI